MCYFESLIGRLGYHGLLLAKRDITAIYTIRLRPGERSLNHDSSIFYAIGIELKDWISDIKFLLKEQYRTRDLPM